MNKLMKIAVEVDCNPKCCYQLSVVKETSLLASVITKLVCYSLDFLNAFVASSKKTQNLFTFLYDF